jgi:outer membrane protein TolC
MFFYSVRPRLVQSITLFFALAALNQSFNVRAQSTQQSDLRQWRNANTEVGRFPRGHIDLLKAERGRVSAGERDSNLMLGAFKEDPAAPELTEQLARNATLTLHADALASQAISIVERMSRDIQLLGLQQATQRLWIEAVSAKEQLIIRQRFAEAASVSLELAKRMENIGNWGRNRRIDIEIGYQSARSQLLVAEQTAFNSRQKLFAQIGSELWRLPNTLPKPKDLAGLSELLTPLEQQLTELLARHPQYAILEKDTQYYERVVGPAMLGQWQQEIDKMIGASASWTIGIPTLDRSKILWNHDLEKAIKARSEMLRLRIKTKTDLQQAREHLRATHTQASDILNKLQNLHSAAEEEALTRYNGMFISTWDLIAKAQTKMQSEVAVAQAKQAFWIALVDMQALLAGAPYSSPGNSANSAEVNSPTGKGH